MLLCRSAPGWLNSHDASDMPVVPIASQATSCSPGNYIECMHKLVKACCILHTKRMDIYIYIYMFQPSEICVSQAYDAITHNYEPTRQYYAFSWLSLWTNDDHSQAGTQVSKHRHEFSLSLSSLNLVCATKTPPRSNRTPLQHKHHRPIFHVPKPGPPVSAFDAIGWGRGGLVMVKLIIVRPPKAARRLLGGFCCQCHASSIRRGVCIFWGLAPESGLHVQALRGWRCKT